MEGLVCFPIFALGPTCTLRSLCALARGDTTRCNVHNPGGAVVAILILDMSLVLAGRGGRMDTRKASAWREEWSGGRWSDAGAGTIPRGRHPRDGIPCTREPG